MISLKLGIPHEKNQRIDSLKHGENLLISILANQIVLLILEYYDSFTVVQQQTTKGVEMLKMSVISKSAVFATIFALALATFSATSVFAASPSTSKQATAQNLTSSWKSETAKLNMERSDYSRLVSQDRKWLKSTNPASADKLSADQYLDKFASYIKQADGIASKHVGFDAFGKVINLTQAAKTIQSLQTSISNLNKVSSRFTHLVSAV